VSLRHKLHSGDIVEILTQPGHRPSRDWLAVVKSSRARQKIKHWLNVHQRERAIEIGKKLIEKEARKYRISLKDIKDDDLLRAANGYGLGRPDDLMAGIGYGNTRPSGARKIRARQRSGCVKGDKTLRKCHSARFRGHYECHHRQRPWRPACLSRPVLQPDTR
jgi:(p)ppGpp synthase/HD superfamily hydrolase